MAQIDREIDLVMLLDVNQALLVLHVDSHKLVADLRCVFCVVNQTDLFGLDV